MQACFTCFVEKCIGMINTWNCFMQKERIRAHVHAGMVKWAGLGQQCALGETLAGRQCPLKRCFSPNVKIYLQNVKM